MSNDVTTVRTFDRRLFLAAAIFFPLTVIAGFGRTYYFRTAFGSPPLPTSLVHVHGLLMSAWTLLFVTQVWLIRSRRVAVHRRLGWISAGLGAAIVPVGLLTAFNAAKFGSRSNPPNIPPLVFFVVPVFDILIFVILFGAALYYRKQAANHKRLIFLTLVNFLPPAIGRLPGVATAGPAVFLGVPALIAIGVLLLDKRKQGHVNKAMLYGTILLIASYPVRFLIGGSAPWLKLAAWLTA